MTDFQRALDQYLEGQLDEDSLDAALRETLTATPGAAQVLEKQVHDLRNNDRVTKHLYDSLITRVRGSDSEADPASDPERKTDNDATAVRANQPVSPRDDMIGAVFRERFILESEIGRGGMGIVYSARDLRREEAGDLHVNVAIKVLSGSVRDNPDAFVALQREAKRAQQLAHPNIATVYDFDREGDTAYLCMELLNGKPLDEILETEASQGLPFVEAIPIIRGMSNGLSYAHERGIVHADFKPNNVLLTDEGVVKILDFGIARVVSKPGQTMKTVFDAGKLQAMTPTYASCEMFNMQDPDPRDDIYALACVSCELLTGNHPFSNLAAPQARAAKLKPAPVAGLNKRQNRALLHGLAFAREDRTPSVDAFVEELAATRGGSTSLGGRGIAAGIGGLVGGVAIAFWLLSGNLPFPSNDTDSGHNATARVETTPADEPGSGTLDKDTTATAGAAPVPDSGPEDGTQAVQGAEENKDSDESGSVAKVARRQLDDETRAKVGRILQIARMHLLSDRLVEPTGSNAAAAYAAVIDLDPGNPESIKGLDNVSEKIQAQAHELMRSNQEDEALELVEKGLKWMPDDAGLVRLHGELTAGK